MDCAGLEKRIESAIRKALYEFDMLEGANKVAVALSGGKDSLTLLYMLKSILGRGFAPLDLVAIHVQGEFSCGAGVQVDFIQDFCHALAVPLIVRESNITLQKLECYSCSRERRGLIFEAAKSVGAHTVAFGHHRDDNAQTLLLNLLHKGEFAGNLPKIELVDFGVTVIRPLIFISEKQTLDFAQSKGFARVVCGCPVGARSMRRKVDELLTEMERLFPNARSNIAMAALLQGSDKARRKKKVMHEEKAAVFSHQ